MRSSDGFYSDVDDGRTSKFEECGLFGNLEMQFLTVIYLHFKHLIPIVEPRSARWIPQGSAIMNMDDSNDQKYVMYRGFVKRAGRRPGSWDHHHIGHRRRVGYACVL